MNTKRFKLNDLQVEGDLYTLEIGNSPEFHPVDPENITVDAIGRCYMLEDETSMYDSSGLKVNLRNQVAMVLREEPHCISGFPLTEDGLIEAVVVYGLPEDYTPLFLYFINTHSARELVENISTSIDALCANQKGMFTSPDTIELYFSEKVRQHDPYDSVGIKVLLGHLNGRMVIKEVAFVCE